MVRKSICLLIILQFTLLPLFAQDYNPLSKLSRGFSNFTLGWIEIPRQMVAVKQEHGDGAGDLAGAFWGPLKGFSYFIGRTVIGAYEVATFLIPSYKPVVQPEYIFSEEDPLK